ncbi:MAG: hypothetical protein US50_C0039G0005 [Candidatus Nomurabacteria bacterium GW2011_GWB1_37_5]|uniref:Uncharacterized protein n=1 Tax=Candidatus Nomurabacteria bacterium GW2011_GWB1_37_5 TaxID=1618742 RepID=A0A0G0JD51_9BACT|nr:MAG: hypothetical protein US50_C0039G0005 [Candidatus Nomurabacteria bacterium GW2011_GWB1_37_5]
MPKSKIIKRIILIVVFLLLALYHFSNQPKTEAPTIDEQFPVASQ